MGECCAYEECEFNGQPECRLPDGMECPHGVKADKPAVKSWLDIEAQIEKLNQYSQSLIAYQMGVEFADVCMDVAAALSTLQAENERLRKELECEREHANAYHEECGQWEAENEKLRAELDAAIKQLHGHCPACTHYTPNHNEGPCQTCKHEYYHLLNNESLDNWEWRGPHKED